jgi:prepilin-type N-terminal cleavage/methylation domain-containing protein
MRLEPAFSPTTRIQGFTITEMVVAMSIAAIIFVSLFSGIAQGFHMLQQARHRLRATQILLEKIEVVRLYNWNQINTEGFVPEKFIEYYSPLPSESGDAGIAYHGTITVTDADVDPAYTNTMRRVVAEITWANGEATNRLKMETLISEYGVQNYIY